MKISSVMLKGEAIVKILSFPGTVLPFLPRINPWLLHKEIILSIFAVQ